MLELDEDVLLQRVQADLRPLLGIDGPPLFITITKWDRSMPQYHLGHMELVREIKSLSEQLPGFALAGNAYEGIGIPDCVRSGEAAAESIIAGL
jgi:oxygen-dependent protoporphyrinogen oxidase